MFRGYAGIPTPRRATTRGQGNTYARRRKKGKRSGNNRGKRKAVYEGMRAGNKQEGGKRRKDGKKRDAGHTGRVSQPHRYRGIDGSRSCETISKP